VKNIGKPCALIAHARFDEGGQVRACSLLYLKFFELLIGQTEYFVLYNTERPHQSLGYKTPDQVYRTASGWGARIVDKYSEKEKTHPEIETKKETGKRGSAVPLHVKSYPLKLDALLS
jgi:putative transposase